MEGTLLVESTIQSEGYLIEKPKRLSIYRSSSTGTNFSFKSLLPDTIFESVSLGLLTLSSALPLFLFSSLGINVAVGVGVSVIISEGIDLS